MVDSSADSPGSQRNGRPLIEVTDKVVMDNGDEVNEVFHTKEESRSYLIKSATSSLSHAKITLATTRRRIETLQRILKVLEEKGGLKTCL